MEPTTEAKIEQEKFQLCYHKISHFFVRSVGKVIYLFKQVASLLKPPQSSVISLLQITRVRVCR